MSAIRDIEDGRVQRFGTHESKGDQSQRADLPWREVSRSIAWATLLLLVSACASAPISRPVPRPHASVTTPTLGSRIRLVRDLKDPALDRSRIGEADLEQARALLSRARKDLEPRHWEPLNRKLSEAQRAWERFSIAASRSGRAAEVERGTEGFAQVGRASEAASTLARVGPVLVTLVLLWPVSTAGPEQDSPPAWANAQWELEDRLRDVAEASRQLMAELEAQPESIDGSPPGLTHKGGPKCEPVPVPHLGGDDTHDRCADVFPPNQFPGHDVLVNGKRFDALQAGARVLWEIKTDRFDTYNAALRRIVLEKQVLELQRERDLAMACGYGFVVGVSSAAHKAALERADRLLNIVVTGCQ